MLEILPVQNGWLAKVTNEEGEETVYVATTSAQLAEITNQWSKNEGKFPPAKREEVMTTFSFDPGSAEEGMKLFREIMASCKKTN